MQWDKYLKISALALAIALSLFGSRASVTHADASFEAKVVGTEGTAVNVRSEPNTDSPILDVLRWGDDVSVDYEIEGESVEGNNTWYSLAGGGYAHSANVAPRVAGIGPWIDIDLSNLVASAIVDGEVVYEAQIVAGRLGYETPVGTYVIWKQVLNETMSSETLGIPIDSVFGYYWEDVLYTQYFTTKGEALHYNYWVDPDAFGQRTTSRGCIGLKLEDAAYFWRFAEPGTVVKIHY